MVAFSSASNACVLSRQPQGAVCMMSQLECVSLQLLQWSQLIPSWWRVDTNTILWKEWYLLSTVLSCTVYCNWTSDHHQTIIRPIISFFGVAFISFMPTKNEETCPDNFLCWQFPGLDHCSTIEVDKWREWKLNFASKFCRFFTSICMEGQVNYIPWHLARSHLRGLRNSDFQTHAAMLGFVWSVYLFSSSVWYGFCWL